MVTPHRYFRYFTYIQPIIKTPFIQTYGSLILTIFSTIIFTVFAIKPTIQTVTILQKQVSDQKQILDELNQKSKNLSSGRKNYLNLDPSIKNKIQTAVPTTPAVGELTRSLEQIAKVSEASLAAVQFQNFTIDKNLAKKSLAEIPFTYNVEGTYSTLLKVIAGLKSMDRLISIEQLNFNKVAGNQTIVLSVSGKAYYLK